MAEPLGLAMSGVALAGLFSTCIEIVEYFEQGKNFAKDFQLALTKVSLMKRRLSQWGTTMSIDSPGAEAKDFRDRWPAESGVIMESLMGIRDILVNTTHMCRRYRCSSKEQQDPAAWLEWKIDGGAGCGRNILKATSPLSVTLYRNESLETLRLKTLWVIKDKKRFQALITDFDFLLGNLEKIGERLQKEKTMANRTIYPPNSHHNRDRKIYFPSDSGSKAPPLALGPVDKRESPPSSVCTSKVSPSSTYSAHLKNGDFGTRSTDSKAEEIHISSRREGEHLYCNNRTSENARMHKGDYYDSATVPNSGKGHLYLNNHARDDSKAFAGNTDGQTLAQMERDQLASRERREAARRENQHHAQKEGRKHEKREATGRTNQHHAQEGRK